MTRHRQWAELLHAVSEPAAGRNSDALLQQAIELGLDTSPQAVGCSVTTIEGDRYRTPVYSGTLALDLDRAQYQAGDGPCMAAAREHRPHHFDAATDVERFRGFADAALARGVHSSISLPLLGTDRPAAINLYASSRAAFEDERAQAVAGLLARCVSTLMPRPDHAVLSTDSTATPDEIECAQARARLITRAEEVLMRDHQLNRQAAFNRLMGRSRAETRSIFHIAQETIDAAGDGVAL